MESALSYRCSWYNRVSSVIGYEQHPVRIIIRMCNNIENTDKHTTYGRAKYSHNKRYICLKSFIVQVDPK